MKSAFAAFKFLTLAGRFDRLRQAPRSWRGHTLFSVGGGILGLVLVLLNRLIPVLSRKF